MPLRAKVLGDVRAEGGGEGATLRADDHAIALVRVRPQRIEEHVVVLGLQLALIWRMSSSVIEGSRKRPPWITRAHWPTIDATGIVLKNRWNRSTRFSSCRYLAPELPAEAAARGKGPLVEVTLLVVAAVDVHAAGRRAGR